jgi:hypothetical protein
MSALQPEPPQAQRPGAPLVSCPECASTLVHPVGWKELPGGALMLHLRCPECLAWIVGSFAPERIAALDDELVRCRELLIAAYDRVVKENMRELAERFRQALELDLIGPDDFALERG